MRFFLTLRHRIKAIYVIDWSIIFPWATFMLRLEIILLKSVGRQILLFITLLILDSTIVILILSCIRWIRFIGSKWIFFIRLIMMIKSILWAFLVLSRRRCRLWFFPFFYFMLNEFEFICDWFEFVLTSLSTFLFLLFCCFWFDFFAIVDYWRSFITWVQI